MKRKPKGRATDVDRHVGQQLRARRLAGGFTQADLGSALGVTLQQIQKYERGINRIGAGSLYKAARFFDCAVDDFYRGIADACHGAGNGAGNGHRQPYGHALRLAGQIQTLPLPQRTALSTLVRSLSAQ